MAENNYLDALEKARQEFALGDPFFMADCSGARYREETSGQGIFTLKYLNRDYQISYPDGEISYPGGEISFVSPEGCARPIPQTPSVDYSGQTILVSDSTLLLMYLKQASGLPIRGQWINFLQLPEGAHHHEPFMIDAIRPMLKEFEGKRDLFLRVAEKLGGWKVKMGDYGVIIPVLPKVELAFVIWEGDEEFPAKGNILFDSSITTYFDTAGAYVLGINVARRLMALAQKERDADAAAKG